MAFDLSFAPEFFIGPYDLETIDFDKDRPTSVYQAIRALSDEEFEDIAREVFNLEPDMVDTSMILDKIIETNTCTDLRSPVDVWIDDEGYYTVRVYDERD